MHEIKIYGEIIPFEDNWIIEQGGFSNLTDLQNQLKSANGADVKVRINSCGGDCDTGFAMYAELRRYAKDNNAKVQTFGEARVASIATVIFLAGDERILTEHTEPFVHNAWTYTMGDSKQIMRAAVELEAYNQKIANHYALHTDLTVDEALALMEAETAITTAEAKQMRFCTDIEEVLRPVALQRFNHKQNDDMNKNEKTVGVLAKVQAFIKSLGAVNKILYDATGTEIDFYELAEDEIAEVGAKARIDGKDADGSYVMTDGATYIFSMGTLTEIVAKAEDVNEEAVALQAEIDNLTTQLEAVTNASQAAITAKDAELVTLRAENLKNIGIIANYKAAKSADAPDDKKDHKKDDKKEGIAAKAISNFINQKPLKTK